MPCKLKKKRNNIIGNGSSLHSFLNDAMIFIKFVPIKNYKINENRN